MFGGGRLMRCAGSSVGRDIPGGAGGGAGGPNGAGDMFGPAGGGIDAAGPACAGAGAGVGSIGGGAAGGAPRLIVTGWALGGTMGPLTGVSPCWAAPASSSAARFARYAGLGPFTSSSESEAWPSSEHQSAVVVRRYRSTALCPACCHLASTGHLRSLSLLSWQSENGPCSGPWVRN